MVHSLMSRHPTPFGQPCAKGHPYSRDIHGRCVECRRARKRSPDGERARQKRKRLRALAAQDYGYLGKKQIRRREGPLAGVEDMRALWKAQGGRCGLTGAPIPPGVRPHVDHIVPVSKGGGSLVGNLHFVHPMANHAKNSHSVEEFRAWLLDAAEALKKKIELEKLI